MKRRSWAAVGRRWLKFNLVGAGGFALQLTLLALLLRLGIHYLAAAGIAVEAAILHNFLWHERWTWRDRRSSGGGRLARLGRFHAANGAVSIVGNLALTGLLVEGAGVAPFLANLVAIGACAGVNFVLGDRWVFAAKELRHDQVDLKFGP